MNAAQFRDALSRLMMSQVRAANLFGAGPRTVRSWAQPSRSKTVPDSVAILLRLMLAKKITEDDVRAALEDE